MKTIRTKIAVFFALCLVFVGVLTGLYYQNTMSLRKKLVIIQNFDDLLKNILELRRYEKNFTYYHDPTSLDESVFYFFKIEGDMSDKLDAIDTLKCPVYMLTGEYDYACSPEDSNAAAKAIQGAELMIMSELGHFPMSENPKKFRTYLLPVLEKILAAER